MSFPVALFWFLDYVALLQDTSIILAIVVSVGYPAVLSRRFQQLLAQFQSTPQAEQTTQWPSQVASSAGQSLGRSLDAWTARISDRIIAARRHYSDLFDSRVESLVAGNGDRLNLLRELCGVRAQLADIQAHGHAPPGPGPLEQQVILAANLPALARFRELWRVLRTCEPTDYGQLLIRHARQNWWNLFRWLMPWRRAWWARLAWSHRWLIKGGRAKLKTASMLMYVAGLLIILANVLLLSDRPDVVYYQWRLRKSNTSDQDRYRSETYVRGALANSKSGKEELGLLMGPVLGDLCIAGEPSQRVDGILQLLMDIHSKSFDWTLVEPLIQCLHTQSADNRLRIQRTLIDLAKADFPEEWTKVAQPEMAAWEPAKEDLPGTVDRCSLAWGDWWAKQLTSKRE
jgi:hypothetical protein